MEVRVDGSGDSAAPAAPTTRAGDAQELLSPAGTRDTPEHTREREQNGRASLCRSESGVYMSAPASTSQLSASTTETTGALWFAIISCFCPAVPINLLALYFAHASHSMVHANDVEGAKRLARRSVIFSVISIILGLCVIFYLIIM